MTTIRNAALSDLPYLYAICNQTGFNGGDASNLVGDPHLLGHLFLAPYVVHAPQWCWVVLDDGLPVGYFVSTPDSKAFHAWMESHWIASVRGYCPAADEGSPSDFERTLRSMVHATQQASSVAGEYPAHIHMDLIPAFQRKGIGTALFDLFHERVRQHAVKGIHIGVVHANPGAMAFYRKQGYAPVRVEDWGVLFGRKGGVGD